MSLGVVAMGTNRICIDGIVAHGVVIHSQIRRCPSTSDDCWFSGSCWFLMTLLQLQLHMTYIHAWWRKESAVVCFVQQSRAKEDNPQ